MSLNVFVVPIELAKPHYLTGGTHHLIKGRLNVFAKEAKKLFVPNSNQELRVSDCYYE